MRWLRYLYANDNKQTRLRQQGEGLVVCDVFSVVSNRVVHGRPGDEEEDEGAVAAVQHAAQEGLLTEVQVELTRGVKLRVLETPAVVHVLQEPRGGERHG